MIGGSIARALREDPSGAGAFDRDPLHLVAWTPSAGAPREALAAGLVDEAARTIAEAVDGAGERGLPPAIGLRRLLGHASDRLAHAAAGACVADRVLRRHRRARGWWR